MANAWGRVWIGRVEAALTFAGGRVGNFALSLREGRRRERHLLVGGRSGLWTTPGTARASAVCG